MIYFPKDLSIYVGDRRGREGHGPLRGDLSFLFTCRGSKARTGRSACSSADQGAFASTCDPADERAGRSTPADLGHVAFSVALSFHVVLARGEGDCLAVELKRG